eukprot:5396361-Alexandrium_andersonii.AAC.1
MLRGVHPQFENARAGIDRGGGQARSQDRRAVCAPAYGGWAPVGAPPQPLAFGIPGVTLLSLIHISEPTRLALI